MHEPFTCVLHGDPSVASCAGGQAVRDIKEEELRRTRAEADRLQAELGAAQEEAARWAKKAEDQRAQLSVLQETMDALQAGSPGAGSAGGSSPLL